jgi:DNA-binding response OmpR family regulator
MASIMESPHVIGAHKRILIADDEPAILDSLRMILEMEGYEVETIQEGDKVLAILGAEPQPRLLVLDIWMSGHDGREICKAIKAGAATSHIPVIMISASKDIAASAFAAGADDMLPKPFEIDAFLNTVRRFAL